MLWDIVAPWDKPRYLMQFFTDSYQIFRDCVNNYLIPEYKFID